MEALALLKNAVPQLWLNPALIPAEEALCRLPFSLTDIKEADARLKRFAPLIAKLFPETEEAGGVIESPLTQIPRMREALGIKGRLFVKRDSELPIAGSVKARGGIYEVLKHTEELLGEAVYSMEPEKIRERLKGYSVQVGSTGNLGLSIGIMSAALGYRAVVHMSSDAKEWKKRLLRERGVEVIEYEGDYSSAVARGRELSAADPMSYFVDDENSLPLFMGYAVAALRLKKQLEEEGVTVGPKAPLNLYLPCGVGGAPGGITFGVKAVFGDFARCFFVEPTQAPCMLAAFLEGRPVPVTELGLSGRTEADGLAVGTASKLVCDSVKNLVSGGITLEDERLRTYQNLLYDKEKIFIEPSSAAAFAFERHKEEIEDGGCVTHIAWATGGRLVPLEERRKQLLTRVSAAIVRRGGRILIAKRPQSKARAGLWEFIGGKLEEGETGEEALKREFREETGAFLTVGPLFTEVGHAYSDINVRISFYEARITGGEPEALEHEALAWASPDELDNYEFCPADAAVVKLLKGAGILKERILALADPGYRAFTAPLVPTVDPETMIGVRIPKLRALAKEFRNTAEAQKFMESLPHGLFEENMLHALLINEEKDFDKAAALLDRFLPFVNNWAVCDTLIPKAFCGREADLLAFARERLGAEHEYTVRLALGVMKRGLLSGEEAEEALTLAASVKREEYYIRMMQAWLFAEALGKCPEKAIAVMESAELDPEVVRMTVRKCSDSRRVSPEVKNYIKSKTHT